MRTVLHFVDGDAVGGVELVALALALSLDRTRWRPVIAHHGGPGITPFVTRVNEAGIETVRVPRVDRAYEGARMPAFVSAVRRVQPDVFHAHLSWPLSCKFGILGATLARVPVTVATAQLFLDVSHSAVVTAQPRWIARLVEHYFAVSHCVEHQLRDTFAIPARKIEYLPNGVDVSRFAAGRLRRSTAPASPRRPPRVITVARLAEQKGHCHLIAAVPLVPEAHFLLVGDGPDRAALEEQARTLGVADRVQFLGGRDDIPELLSEADVFVLPSLFEGLPIAVLEAMAAGTPVVATAIGGTDEIVAHDETGLLVPPADPSALAAAIRSVLDDPAAAHRRAVAALAMVMRDFTFEHIARRVTAVYDKLLIANT